MPVISLAIAFVTSVELTPLLPGSPFGMENESSTLFPNTDTEADACRLEIRLRRGLITDTTLSLQAPQPGPDTIACWRFEPSPGFRHDSVTGSESIRPVSAAESSAREAAVSDLCHSLLSSSPLLYIE